jgi:16S rRNA (guanine966-N2)-methyltransferase
MRVVAGELRGRRIVAPAGESTRPTTDKVREAVFNALGSQGVLVDAHVADLYAGSGALGIEALSRGAAHCVFVERDRNALRALRENLSTLGLDDRSRVVTGDVLAVAASVVADVVFADPPYEFEAWERLLGVIRSSMVVAEAGHELAAPQGWELTRSKRYGRTWVSFLVRTDGELDEVHGDHGADGHDRR